VRRQIDLEGRPVTRLAVNVDEAVVLLDRSVNHGQSQAGSFTYLLGGEERLENVGEHPCVHAAAIIAHRQQDVFAGDKAGVTGAVLPIKDDVVRLDGDLARIGDGVPGVDAQVGQDLVHLRGIDKDAFEIVPRQPGQIDVLADEPSQHLERTLHGLVEVQYLEVHGLLAGKRQKLARQIGRTLGGLLDLVQTGTHRLVRPDFQQGQLRMTNDDAKHIVEVMGDAAG